MSDKRTDLGTPYPSAPSLLRLWVVLCVGVLAVSTAALFARMAQGSGASSLAIATGRLGIAACIMLALAWRAHGTRGLTLPARTQVKFALVGALLAAHFWSWFASLEYIPVALSTALVTTTPIWVALGAWAFRAERLRAAQWFGLLLAIGGGVALALTSGEGSVARSLARGALLALVGAIAMASTMLLGQHLRGQFPVQQYVALLYGWAAVWLLLATLVTATPLLGLAHGAYLAMLALALVPQLIGHTALNWALPYLGATTVAVTVLAEPVGAAVLAALFLNERMTGVMVLCFACTLAGILLVARNKND